MKRTARLDAIIVEFLAGFEQQKELRKRSRLSDEEFDKVFNLYVDVENPYREFPFCEPRLVDTTMAASQKPKAEAKGIAEEQRIAAEKAKAETEAKETARLKAEMQKRETLENHFANYEKKFGLLRTFLENIFASNAEMFTRLRALQKSSGLPPGKFMDALAEYQRRQLLKSKGKKFPNLALENAKTVEEHLSIYRHYGVLWWWRLKESDVAMWNGRILMERVIENGVEYRVARSFSDLFWHRYQRSAYEYERLARKNEKGKPPQFKFGMPWSMLTREQMDELAQERPMPQGERIPYLWRTCSEPWANEYVLRNHAFDLRASPSALAEAFKEIIRIEKKRREIKDDPRKGKRTRPFEWKAIECLDLANYEDRKFRDKDLTASKAGSRRSALSRALKRSKK